MQFFPLSLHLILLSPNILLSTLFSNTPSVCSSLNESRNIGVQKIRVQLWTRALVFYGKLCPYTSLYHN
jgi:hypothetical protein